MRNLKRWKRLMAVAMCSAMMLSVPMGVSATDSGDTQAPVTDNAEIVDTDTPDDTDTDTSDGTDTPDGSGDVTPPTDNDGTDTDAGDGTENDGTEEDGGEDTGKTKVTLTDKYGMFSSQMVDYRDVFSSNGFTYSVEGVSKETLNDIINVEIVSAKLDGIDFKNYLSVEEVEARDFFGKVELRVVFWLDCGKFSPLVSYKKPEEFKVPVEFSITSKNDLYELEVDESVYTMHFRFELDDEEDTPNEDFDSNPKYTVSDVNISKARMQELVEINKEQDIVINTPVGVTFTFAKGTMHMVEGMENYPFGVDLVTDYSKSGINDSKITEDTFAFRINYEYSGELPGTARISIPVNSKWNGSTLYYYQIMPDGTLKDTGRNSRVTNGIFNVYQTHCSDYVLLANSPKELGLTSTKVPTSPKTGDTSTAMLFMILCMGACLAGAGAVKVKCNNR